MLGVSHDYHRPNSCVKSSAWRHEVRQFDEHVFSLAISSMVPTPYWAAVELFLAFNNHTHRDLQIEPKRQAPNSSLLELAFPRPGFGWLLEQK